MRASDYFLKNVKSVTFLSKSDAKKEGRYETLFGEEVVYQIIVECMDNRELWLTYSFEEVNPGIKTTKIFGCYNSVFQFKIKLLLIDSSWCKTYRFHTFFKPFVLLIRLSKFCDTFAFMWNSLCFTISARSNHSILEKYFCALPPCSTSLY